MILPSKDEFDLNLLRILDAVLREGSTIGAAKRLGVTQSSISHALRRLRTYFQDPLFSRGKNGLILSPLAVELSSAIGPVLRRISEDILSVRSFDPFTSEREIRLILTDVGELSMVPWLTRMLERESPRSSLRVLSSSPRMDYNRLANGEADVIITTRRVDGPDLHRQWLFKDGFVVLGHQSLMGKGYIDLDEYCRLEHISVQLPGKDLTLVDEGLAKIGRTRKVRFITEHYMMVPYLMAQHPELVASVPTPVVRASAVYGDFAAVPMPFAMEDIEVFQFWHGLNNRSEFHCWVRGLIKRYGLQHGALGHSV